MSETSVGLAEAIDLTDRHIVTLFDNKDISGVTKIHSYSSYDIDDAVNRVAVTCYTCSINLDAP